MMTDEQIARLRLRRQHLTGAPLASPEAVLSWLGAAQAQEFGPAKWSLARRSRGTVTEAQIDELLTEGRILRSHLLRPTWHFVLPADLRWIMQATAHRVHALNGYAYRQFGIDDPALVRRTQDLLRRALAGGQALTRQEIGARFAAGRVTAPSGVRLAYLLMRAELDLVICSGPRRGKQHTYALVDERVPAAPPCSPDEALKELTRRYFTSHGPATLKDFLWWSSLTVREARRGLELLGSQLRKLVVGDATYWMGEGAARSARPASPPVHLLQAYDEYGVAYTESKRVLGAIRVSRATVPPRLSLHTIVRDGRVVGHWRRADTKQAIVEATLHHPLDRAARRGLDEEMERYRRFLEQPARLVLRG